jgi:glycerophosphoryl diester phosphodiesterase
MTLSETPFHAILDATRPLVIAHRGGAALLPENTLAAFERGLAVGADGLELDVHLSRDGAVVVCHDELLERTTNGRGRVRDRTADDLAALDAAWRFGEADGFPLRGAGIGVPRLREVLTKLPAVPLIVELKGRDLALAAATVAEVRAAGALTRTCFGSFSRAMLQAVRRCGPDVVTSADREEIRWALYRSWVGLLPRRPRYRAFQVPERHGATRIVSPHFVAAMQRVDLPVHVWTVNEASDMRRLLSWGVMGLITDRPDVGVQVMQEFARQANRQGSSLPV